MKAWIMRLAAAVAVAVLMSGCAGMGSHDGSDLPVHEETLSD
jgi:uncharacterized protein YceK